MKRQKLYHSLLALDSVAHLDINTALDQIGQLIDLAHDLGEESGINHGLALLAELRGRDLSSSQLATSYYFEGNACSCLNFLRRSGGNRWEWEQPEVEQEITAYRLALRYAQEPGWPAIRKCQTLTNLGNLLNYIGRFIEAIEYWDNALEFIPDFGMAIGNRGQGLMEYAEALHDLCYQRHLLRCAILDLRTALVLPLEGNAHTPFRISLEYLEQTVQEEQRCKRVYGKRSLGRTKNERVYRIWCLNKRLFLNSLNDTGAIASATHDIMALPDVTTGIYEGPGFIGMYNQLKQEYVSARFLFYESIQETPLHFSDRAVALADTLDYPAYGLRLDKMRIAFRIAYSIFDKIAYFLNHYLGLGIKDSRVTFRTFWYTSQQKDKGLRSEFSALDNWPLRGLFWLSKDLHENKPGFQESMEPGAQALSEIRNHLEHKYLKLHNELWSGPLPLDHPQRLLTDDLAFSLHDCDFEDKTLHLLKLVRSALMYLALAVQREEHRRRQSSGKHGNSIPMSLPTFKDEWKS